MTTQPSFVNPVLLQELSESFRLHNQIPSDLYTRFRIKRGLRNADGTGVLVGASRLGNVHGYILNEGEREPIEGRLTYRGYNVYDLIHGLEQEDRFGFEEVGYLLMCGALPTRRQLDEFQRSIGLERALPDNFTEDMIMRAPSRDIMNKLAGATLALYSYDPNPDETTVENIMRQGISLMAKFPVIISHAYQAKRRYFDGDSMFLHVPDPDQLHGGEHSASGSAERQVFGRRGQAARPLPDSARRAWRRQQLLLHCACHLLVGYGYLFRNRGGGFRAQGAAARRRQPARRAAV